MTAAVLTPLARSINGHLEAQALVVAIGGQSYSVTSAILDGAPFSKSRPRFSRNGHTYVPQKDRDAEERTSTQLRAVFAEPFTGNVALACIFYRPNFQRIDVDNMLKHVCDAANGIVWDDDSQITALVGTAHLDVDDPRTIIAVAPHESTLLRGSDAIYPCVVCSAPINRSGQAGKLRKTCSRECRAQAMGHQLLDEPVPCAWCGEAFKRVSSYRKYCSTDCRAAAYTNVRKGIAKPPVRCTHCGTELAHRRGGRCRGCWRADPKGLNPPLPTQPELELASECYSAECWRVEHASCAGCDCVCHLDAGARVTVRPLTVSPADSGSPAAVTPAAGETPQAVLFP
jgi:Holliday junction resolvase RusA-like endonuclease